MPKRQAQVLVQKKKNKKKKNYKRSLKYPAGSQEARECIVDYYALYS